MRAIVLKATAFYVVILLLTGVAYCYRGPSTALSVLILMTIGFGVGMGVGYRARNASNS